MVELNKIPHINEISNHGAFAGAREKKTATFRERYHQQNKVVSSLEEAIRRTGLRDGMTISFHHHFRNGDHIINMVVDKLAEMGYKNLTLAASSLATVHAPLIRHIKNGVITHIETSGLRGELAEEISRGLMDCPVVFRSHGGRPAPSAAVICTSTWRFWARPPVTPTATPTVTAGTMTMASPAARWAMPAPTPSMPTT